MGGRAPRAPWFTLTFRACWRPLAPLWPAVRLLPAPPFPAPSKVLRYEPHPSRCNTLSAAHTRNVRASRAAATPGCRQKMICCGTSETTIPRPWRTCHPSRPGGASRAGGGYLHTLARTRVGGLLATHCRPHNYTNPQNPHKCVLCIRPTQIHKTYTKHNLWAAQTYTTTHTPLRVWVCVVGWGIIALERFHFHE